MNVMWSALAVFAVLCLVSWLAVSNLYKSMEIKDLREKLSWYTQPVAPVPMVLADQEVSDEEV